MKTSFIIRLVVAALLATLACIGFAADIPVLGGLIFISWLLLMPRGTLTRPIPRSERWWAFLLVGVVVAVLLTLPFLKKPPEPSRGVRAAAAVLLWLLWMLAGYSRWRRVKREVDTERMQSTPLDASNVN